MTEEQEKEVFGETCQRAMELFQEQLDLIEHESGGFKVQCTASAWVFVAVSALHASGASSSEIRELVQHTEEMAARGLRQMLHQALGTEETRQ